MKVLFKILKAKLLLVTVAVVAVGVGVALFLLARDKKQIDVMDGRVAHIKTMVRLSSVEIYREVPVVDTVNSKVICAIQKQRGSISFDIEKLRIDSVGDTLIITLPREIIDIYEATDPNSWQVVDTKAIGNLSMIQSGKLTNYEENIVKSRLNAKAKRELYRDGTVQRARTEATANLRSLAEKLYRKPVIVKEN